MPPPIAADLRACADGSAVRTALVACRAAALPVVHGIAGLGAHLGQLGQTDGRMDGSRYRLMPLNGGGIITLTMLSTSTACCSLANKVKNIDHVLVSAGTLKMRDMKMRETR